MKRSLSSVFIAFLLVTGCGDDSSAPTGGATGATTGYPGTPGTDNTSGFDGVTGTTSTTSTTGADGITGTTGTTGTTGVDGTTSTTGATGTDSTTGSTSSESCFDGDNDGAIKKSPSCPTGTDCNDNDPNIKPGATDVCGDNIDQDCSGFDEPCCVDNDLDGAFGKTAICPTGPDCNDTDKTVGPTATEICGDNIDQDCNGSDEVCCTPQCAGKTCGDDGCGGVCGECAPTEICGADSNCAPQADPNSCEGKCGEYSADATCQCDSACSTFGDCCDDLCDKCTDIPAQCGCLDEDGDTYGEGPKCQGADCDDTNADVNPGVAAELDICGDGIDQDCDGVDPECPVEECTEESDADGDGVGGASGCDPKDCNDNDKAIYPGAPEICGDGIDQDCNGQDLPCPTVDCTDEDGDEYGEGADCKGPDCNDLDPKVNPGVAAELDICGDGIDQDCTDGDPECPSNCVDEDGDGHFKISEDCPTGDDCNDLNKTVNPAAVEICGDLTDQDCNGSDLACPEPEGCKTNDDCDTGLWCNTKTEECITPKYWQVWAPVVYMDTQKNSNGRDFFTVANYDGDEIGGNNGDNVNNSPKKAKVYYSYSRTSTHAFVGYHFYFPQRWSNAVVLGTKYENAMRSVMLVIQLDGGTFGNIEMMITSRENDFRFYANASSPHFNSFPVPSGPIKYANGRPVVYIDSESHNITGDAGWDTKGFPGGNGFIFNWSFDSTTPADKDVIGEGTYELVEMLSTLWPQRLNTGDTKMFSKFGQFAGDDAGSKSLPPWAMRDTSAGILPSGEFLFDTATFVRHYFLYDWSTYDFRYTYNPYAIEVEVRDLKIKGGGDAFGGDPDIFMNLIMWDGKGEARKMLAAANGIQNSWKKDNVKVNTLISMKTELGRYWFYGMNYPGKPGYFGVEVKDADTLQDDWLMEPAKTSYHSLEGVDLLDWGLSDSVMACDIDLTK